MGNQSYTYQPLKPANQPDGEFRILTLLPGESDSQIECNLQRAPINSPPPYEALSYTWGNPKGRFNNVPPAGNPSSIYAIIVDGLHHTVTYNLYLALQHLRDNSETRVLWIDALCIDQRNTIEKGEQVQMMAEVYQRASRVVVWLGEHDQYTDLAFDTLEEICWATKVLVHQYVMERYNIPMGSCSEETLMQIISSEADWDGSSNDDHVSDDSRSDWADSDTDMQGHVDSATSLPFQRDSVEVLESTSSFESQDEPRCISPFSCLYREEFGHFVSVLSSVEVAFSAECTDLPDLALAKWGTSDSVAAALISNACKVSDLPSFQARIEALEEIFIHRSYWFRIWIVQELLLSSKNIVMCGQRAMNFEISILIDFIQEQINLVEDGPKVLKSRDNSIRQLTQCLHNIWDYFNCRWRDQRDSLACMLDSNCEMECSEPRDAIYALLKISKPIDIYPNYEIPVAEVYMSATRTIIDQEQSLNILCNRLDSLSAKRYKSLLIKAVPTWVPQYQYPLIRYGNLHNLLYEYAEQYYSCGGPLPLQRHSDSQRDPRTLQLTGSCLETIESSGTTISGYAKTANDFFEFLCEMKDAILQKVAMLGRPLSDLDYWRTLLTDQYAVKYELYQRIVTSEDLSVVEADLELSMTSEPQERFVDALQSSTLDKMLCITSSGRLALVYGDSKPGDTVFVARGASMPFVLRRSKKRLLQGFKMAQDISTYELVGGAYVHGIMDGEVREMMDRGEVKEEDVFLV